LINETMARQYWPQESAIGKRVQLAAETTRFREIVGVVGDVRMNGPEEQVKPVIYVPYAQNSWPNAIALSHVVIRTHQEPASIISAVRRELRSLDPELVLYQPRPMDEAFMSPLAPRRFTMVLLTSFAGLGAVLALIGVFGVVSYTVNQRRYEVGVRLALGATRHKIFAQFLRQGAGLTFIGIAAGGAGSIALTQALSGFLFGVAATDAWTFASVASIFIATSLAACSIPAIRAARIEASMALRTE
jgi:predicted lysophospholipase L1 biosynthesis ABC-type transport system permease subunit